MNTRRNLIIGRALAIGSALANGTGDVLVRQGVANLAPPLVGAAIALLSGALILGMIELGSPESNLRQKKRSVGLLVVTGVSAGLGVAGKFFALSLAPVVVVAPIAGITPLFSLLWSRLFLHRLERVTPRIILGATLVVGGIALITIGRVT